MDGLVCDLDGVIYRGEQQVPGAAEALAALAADGIPVVFCTNHSRLTVTQYRERLSGFGIEVEEHAIVTSAVATGAALAARGLSGARALVIGQDGVREAVAAAGTTIEPNWSAEVELVVVGWDDRFSYDAMRHAATAIRRGAAFIATNDDATLPRSDGSVWPGAGALCAAIAVAAGREPEVMGKPHRGMMDAAQQRLAGARRIAIVGDNPASDLAGGRLMGWKTVLVLSGVTDRVAAAALTPPPDLTLDSIADLPSHLSVGSQENLDGGS